MTTIDVPRHTVHEPAEGVRVRGSLAVIAGAGETSRVYERFGRRISTDGYIVGVFEAAAAEEAVQWLTAHEYAPRVLVGSDRGAAIALTVAADGAAIDGVVVAGIPVAGDDAEAAGVEQRTSCPVHLGVLGTAEAVSSTASATTTVPDPQTLAAIAVPVLAIHGEDDPLAPLTAAREAVALVDQLEFVETVHGLHDALNDISHRSVAASIVLWLERLRADGVAVPIVRVAR